MVKLGGFFDESDTGQQGRKQIFLLGGWVADMDTWGRFSDDWHKELSRPPKIKYFSHNEAKGQSGQFEAWSETDADNKISALARVVDRHIDPRKDQYGIFTGMKPEVLRILLGRLPASARQVRSVLKLTQPYEFCFFSLTGLVLQHELSINRAVKVDFVFDESKLFRRCSQIYREMKKLMSPEMAAVAGNATEGNDRDFAPLQAADLLVGQATTNLKTGKPERPFQVLSHGNRVMYSPIRWGEDAVLSGFAATLEYFSVAWSTLMLEKAKRRGQ